MIKETIDAVRLAESEAEKMIRTAEEDALNQKNQIKSQAKAYREDAFGAAQKKAEQQMNETVQKCSAYEEQTDCEIQAKTTALQDEALDRMDKAVKAVIDALV